MNCENLDKYNMVKKYLHVVYSLGKVYESLSSTYEASFGYACVYI